MFTSKLLSYIPAITLPIGFIFKYIIMKTYAMDNEVAGIISILTIEFLLLLFWRNKKHYTQKELVTTRYCSYVIILALSLNIILSYGLNIVSTSNTSSKPLLLYTVVLGPIMEEFLFRGLCIDYCEFDAIETKALYSALLFALFHMNLAQAILAFPVGYYLAILRIKSDSFRYSVLCHMLINLLAIIGIEITNVVLPMLATIPSGLLINKIPIRQLFRKDILDVGIVFSTIIFCIIVTLSSI